MFVEYFETIRCIRKKEMAVPVVKKVPIKVPEKCVTGVAVYSQKGKYHVVVNGRNPKTGKSGFVGKCQMELNYRVLRLVPTDASGDQLLVTRTGGDKKERVREIPVQFCGTKFSYHLWPDGLWREDTPESVRNRRAMGANIAATQLPPDMHRNCKGSKIPSLKKQKQRITHPYQGNSLPRAFGARAKQRCDKCVALCTGHIFVQEDCPLCTNECEGHRRCSLKLRGHTWAPCGGCVLVNVLECGCQV